MVAGTQAEYQSDAGSTKETPYLTLRGEPWGLCCGDFRENWPCYNGTALYLLPIFLMSSILYKMFIHEKNRPTHIFTIIINWGNTWHFEKRFRGFKRNSPREQGQHNGCWCPGSLPHQTISSHGTDYAWKTDPHYHDGGFRWPLPPQHCKMIQNTSISLCFLE